MWDVIITTGSFQFAGKWGYLWSAVLILSSVIHVTCIVTYTCRTALCAFMVQYMCAVIKLTCIVCHDRDGRCPSRDSLDGCFECYDYEISRPLIWCGHREYLCCHCLPSYLQFLLIDRCPRANSSECRFPRRLRWLLASGWSRRSLC